MGNSGSIQTIMTLFVVDIAIIKGVVSLSLGSGVKEMNNSFFSNHNFDAFFLTKNFDPLVARNSTVPPRNKHCLPSVFREDKSNIFSDITMILSTTRLRSLEHPSLKICILDSVPCKLSLRDSIWVRFNVLASLSRVKT